MKSKLKAPGAKRLKLKYGEPLSNFAFNFKLAPLHQGAGDRALPAGATRAPHGEAVQGEPMKSKLKGPGTKRLKLKYNVLLSSFAINFNLRRYPTAV